MSGLTNGMSGIRSPLQGSSRDDSETQGVALGCDGSGRWPSRYMAPAIAVQFFPKRKQLAPPRLRVTPLESDR
jgi:hypothetical protein